MSKSTFAVSHWGHSITIILASEEVPVPNNKYLFLIVTNDNRLYYVQ